MVVNIFYFISGILSLVNVLILLYIVKIVKEDNVFCDIIQRDIININHQIKSIVIEIEAIKKKLKKQTKPKRNNSLKNKIKEK